MRSLTLRLTVGISIFILGPAWTCAAQGIGVGGRFSMVRGDVKADTSAERFAGAHFRGWLSTRTAVEVSIARHVQTNQSLTEQVRDIPLQGSLLFAPISSTVAPYVLGGMGWYSHKVEQLLGEESVDSMTTHRVGAHAGFGAEVRMGKHAAFHADYRYTFLRFGAADPMSADTIASAVSKSHLSADGPGARFLPSYQGSMWTTGLTLYF